MTGGRPGRGRVPPGVQPPPGHGGLLLEVEGPHAGVHRGPGLVLPAPQVQGVPDNADPVRGPV